MRLERLNIVNKNKDTQKIQEQILQYRNRLDQITSDRSMLELEIKSQMNLIGVMWPQEGLKMVIR